MSSPTAGPSSPGPAAPQRGSGPGGRQSPPPAEGPVRLARAITRPHGRAVLLAADNTAIRWVSIEAAVASGQAYAVELRRDLFAADGDHPDAEQATAALAVSLRCRGLESVVVPSGQPGRWHLFCRIASPELRRRVAVQARQLGLDVRRSIRPPWSPHRLGLPVARPTPDQVDAAVATLGPRRTHGRLSAATRRRLRHGDPAGAVRTDGAPKSRSESDWAVALGFVHAGHDESDLWRALTDPRNTAGAKVRELLERRGVGEARRYVRLRYQRATAYVAAHPPIATPTDARVEILAIQAQLDSMSWHGPTGDSDRAVMEAECQLRLQLGRLTASASVREIAERAGMTRPTVTASRRRLQAQGLLKLIPTDHRSTHALTWKICAPHAAFAHADLQPPSGGRQGMGKSCVFEVWRHVRAGGLGKGCWRVWRLLDQQEPRTAEGLAAELTVHPSTVRRRLTQLAKVGLAARLDGAWVPGVRDLADVARELGADQAAARQRERHDQERDTWEQQIADRRARHLADDAERYLADLDEEEREAAAAVVAEAHTGQRGRQEPPAEQPRPLQLHLAAVGGAAAPPPARQLRRPTRQVPTERARPGHVAIDPELGVALKILHAAFGTVQIVGMRKHR